MSKSGNDIGVGLTLSEWLEQTEGQRADLYAYAKTPLPSDLSERHADEDKAIQASDDAGRLLSDCQYFLTQEIARQTLAVTGMSAPERRAVVKDKVKDLQRLVDGIQVTATTLKSRIFLSMSQGRRHP